MDINSWIDNWLVYHEKTPLLFTQLYFWGFFGVVLLVYSFVYKKNTLRTLFLLLFSLFFYYKSGGYFIFLLIFTILSDYLLGRLIYSASNHRLKKLWVSLSVIVNLSVLAYFKYFYFFIDSINQLFQTHLEAVNIFSKWSNELTGSHFDISTIILPVGISFFTFQSLSYTLDIYRNKLNPVKNILDYALFVSFFPQLISGPIVRASAFIPQISHKYNLSGAESGHAIFLILNGLIKKIIVADFISINLVDRIFDSPLSYSGFENLMAVYAYTLQIYCDFSGYTDIATGVALLLGFRLPVNFNSPYKATSVRDFWRRWHISLSTWLRDYLYISLGGSRKGKFRTYLNLFLTMLLGGLWHGANIRFVIWGTLHGLGLVVNRLWDGINPIRNKSNRFYRLFSIVFTFHFVAFAWMFFRAENINSVLNMLEQISHHFDFVQIPQIITGYKSVFLIVGFAYLVHWLPASFKETYRGWFIQTPVAAKVAATVLIVFFLYQSKSSALQPFIYFQF